MNFIHRFFLFLLAPILGFFLTFYFVDPLQQLQPSKAQMELESSISQMNEWKEQLTTISTLTESAKQITEQLVRKANEEQELLTKQNQKLEELIVFSKTQKSKSDAALEQILSSLLGEPIDTHEGKHSTIKIYSLVEAGYRGYMAKVRVHRSDALKLVLADDQVVSSGETPSQAAKRLGGILAVNAGGFWRTGDGKMAPLGITVVDGKIKTFYDHPTLSFVGFNTNGHLVGGKITTKEQLEQLNVLQGSSFVPTLLENGKKTAIPADWKNARHPRTIVGNFSNGELLFIVVDSRQKGWSAGVTLEEMQDKLLSFKVKDAFNLDGGGSSAFYYNGKILNKPSDGKERPVTSNIVIMP